MVEFLVTIDYELVSVQWKGGIIFALCILGEDVMNVGCSKVVLHRFHNRLYNHGEGPY